MRWAHLRISAAWHKMVLGIGYAAALAWLTGATYGQGTTKSEAAIDFSKLPRVELEYEPPRRPRKPAVPGPQGPEPTRGQEKKPDPAWGADRKKEPSGNKSSPDSGKQRDHGKPTAAPDEPPRKAPEKRPASAPREQKKPSRDEGVRGKSSGPVWPERRAAQTPFRDAAARLIVIVPADAKLYIDGMPTPEGSDLMRAFASPVLRAGRDYSYLVRAEVRRRGEPISWFKVVVLRAGEDTRVSFLKELADRESRLGSEASGEVQR